MYFTAQDGIFRDVTPIREKNCLEFLSSLRDLVPFWGYPGLAPWALVCRPFGAGVLLACSASSSRAPFWERRKSCLRIVTSVTSSVLSEAAQLIAAKRRQI